MGSRETRFHFCIVLYDLTFKIEHLFMLLVIKVKLNSNNNHKKVCVGGAVLWLNDLKKYSIFYSCVADLQCALTN